MIRSILDRVFSHSSQAGGPARSKQALTLAYQRLFDGNGSKQDAEMVLTDLADITGYFRRPSFSRWLEERGTPAGYELHSALSNARAEVVQSIMDRLNMTEDDMVALEKAARLEARL